MIATADQQNHNSEATAANNLAIFSRAKSIWNGESKDWPDTIVEARKRLIKENKLIPKY